MTSDGDHLIAQVCLDKPLTGCFLGNMAPKVKPISERGKVQPNGNNWRVEFWSVSRLVRGPTRKTFEEAAADLDIFRAASSEDEIAQIAQRLMTESAAAAPTAAATAASSGLKPLEGGGSASAPAAVPLESRAAAPGVRCKIMEASLAIESSLFSV